MFSKKSWMTLLALLIVSSLVLAGCGAAPEPEVVEVEKVVTQEVEKVITQVVQETVIVEGTSQVVEKVVEKVVTEIVEVEMVVTATPEAAEIEAADETTVVIGMPSGFDILDPNITTFTRVGRMTLHMTDPLIWQVEPGVFVPGLATEWSVNEDATEYTFKLRDDVTFHDGTPFNAEAVKFTFDRIVDPAQQVPDGPERDRAVPGDGDRQRLRGHCQVLQTLRPLPGQCLRALSDPCLAYGRGDRRLRLGYAQVCGHRSLHV